MLSFKLLLEKSLKESEIKKKIFSECTEILKIYGQTEHRIYRGMDLEEDYLKIKSRKRRKALDSDQKEQNAFDAFMEQRGLIAKRGNSFFCSGDSERAETYGNIYYVFPVNGFNFSWSLTAVDEVLQPGDVTESTFEEWDQYFQMTDKNLAAAMESKNEIYINGEAYVIRNPFEFNYGPGEEFEIFERKIKEEYKL